MADRKLMPRQFVLSILALWYDLSFKEIGAAAGMPQKQVSQSLRPLKRRKDLTDRVYERLLAAIPCPPAAVHIVTACAESLEALGRDELDGLTVEERAEIEQAVLVLARQVRKVLTEAVLLSRAPLPCGYPQPEEVAPCRQRAAVLWELLADLRDEVRPAVVQVAKEFQSWSLCERICDESEREAARESDRSVARASALARLAQEIAERVPGPPEWQARLRGYAAAHVANGLRISGDLNAADAALDAAKRLWRAGADPDSVLDPGRLFDLEASLRRDQRRFPEALEALDEAIAVARSPARALLTKGSTLEVMGEHGRAVETLLQALPHVERMGDLRLSYALSFNLAVNYCRLGRHAEARDWLERARALATDLGDEVSLIRVVRLEGLIAADPGAGRGVRIQGDQTRYDPGLRFNL